MHSAHYAGTQGGREERDARNNAKLLGVLENTAAREATFVSVIVLLRHAADPEPLVAEGRWLGTIARAPRGANGFGYDPLFVVEGRGVTPAKLSDQEKNHIRPLGQALARLLALLRERAQ